MDRSEVLRLLYRNQFDYFYRFAFRQAFDGKQRLDNWHIDYLLGVLSDCLEGKTTRAIINAPPRHSKSFLASIAYPLFALGQNPKLKIMVLTADRELAHELESTARKVMSSSQMFAVFPYLAEIGRQPRLRLASGGEISYGVFGKSIVGRGIDIVIIDDPISPDDALDDKFRTEINEWYKSDLVPRISDRASNVVIVVMQRLHPNDLTGMLLKNQENWRHCEFSAVATQDECWTMRDGRIHERLKGEILHPDKMSKDQHLATLEQIGVVQFSAQYQQNMNIRNERRYWWWFAEEHDDAWYDNWTPESGIEGMAFGYIPEIEFMRYELFGVGPPPPKYYRPRLTFEQVEQSNILHQRRLLESMQDD